MLIYISINKISKLFIFITKKKKTLNSQNEFKIKTNRFNFKYNNTLWNC